VSPAAVLWQAMRFVGVGVANALLTLLLYQVLLFVVSYTVAYTLSFAAGIAFAAVVYARVVFATRLTWWTALRFTVAYLALYGLGLFVTIWLVELASVPERMAPIATALLLLPLSFLASRFALNEKRQHSS
jgi:putative flippase GtrA